MIDEIEGLEEMGYGTKNFRMQGGDATVFAGATAFLGGVYIGEDCQVEGFPKAAFMETCSAAEVFELTKYVNELVENLKKAGLMESSEKIEPVEEECTCNCENCQKKRAEKQATEEAVEAQEVTKSE